MPLPISVRLPPYLLSYVVTLLIQLAMFYPILLRANVSLLLYKREKSATRAVLLSSVLQILGIVVGGYNYIWLSATYKFQCIYDEITGEDLYHGMTMVDYYTEDMAVVNLVKLRHDTYPLFHTLHAFLSRHNVPQTSHLC